MNEMKMNQQDPVLEKKEKENLHPITIRGLKKII